MEINIRYQLLGLVIGIFLFGKNTSAQVTLTEESWVLPTYMVEEAEKAPIFFTGESYQGARKVIYPYALNDVISKEKEMHGWKTLRLENDFIELGITPEIGGKLYYATDKSNGYNFIYKNNEVKPSNIGMTGAWVSGGIEWCVFHHHRPSTMIPIDYSTSENEDGSKTIYVGETEPRHRMRWTVGITVHPDKSYFEAEVSVYNPTPYTNTFLYWANVAAHANENFQTIFPPSVDFATFHSKNDFTQWPISTEEYVGQDFTAGVDVSYWKNVKGSASFFAWDLQEDFMGGYDHGSNTGTVHIGDHNIVKGAKVWEWGSGPVGQATEGRLTETSGPYVEIMSGAYSDNQPDYTWIKPFEVKRWKQYWYPVKDIEGFKNANIDAAVNLEKRDNNKVFLGYHSTQILEKAMVLLKRGDEIIFRKEVEITPKKAFTQIIDLKTPFDVTDLYTELVNTKTNKTVISYQPVKKEAPEILPKEVTPPQSPEEIETVEELFLTGSKLEQFYKDPKEYYQEALKRDPTHSRTHTALGFQDLKDGDFKKARNHFSTAIKRITKDYIRPKDAEPLYLQGITLKALELYEAAIDTLYRATWDQAYHSAAYFELAQISSMQENYKKALHEINQSLSTNTRNTRATGLKISLLRKLGNMEEAKQILETVRAIDPLNFRLANEEYLIVKASGNTMKADESLASFTKMARGFNQNYLELAIKYLNDGLLEEAEDVLIRYPMEDPIIDYHLGYIHHKKHNEKEARSFFNEATSHSTDYVFPYRLETIKALKIALDYNPDDGKANYYLGNILYDKQPEEAIESWKRAVEQQSNLAMAFRNLGWGYFRHYKDYQKAINYYEQAIKLNDKEAIFYTELDELYELNNSPVAERLEIFEGKEDIVSRRDDAFVRQITVLTLAGKHKKSVDLLDGKKFSYREGNSRVREVIIDAHLQLGLEYMEHNEYEKALDQFILAQVPDEEAGSARLGNRDIQVNYFIGEAYKVLGEKEKANKYFNLAVNEETSNRYGIMNYYKGQSYSELKNKKKAQNIFQSMIAEGEKIIQNKGEEDQFFTIFGEKESENVRMSKAHTLIGLGYKGLGKNSLAKEHLSKAIQLSASNLWAATETESI